MDYCFTLGPPYRAEDDALALVADLGYYALVFDLANDGGRAVALARVRLRVVGHRGTVLFQRCRRQCHAGEPGMPARRPCRLAAPEPGRAAGVVLGTSLPGEQWTSPIDKDLGRASRGPRRLTW